MKWHYAGPLLTDQTLLKGITISGKKLVIIKQAEKYFALAAKCPHAGADLSNGWCAKGKLICPVHRYAYDIQTGKGNPGQNDYIDTYPVDVRADGFYIGIKSFLDIFR